MQTSFFDTTRPEKKANTFRRAEFIDLPQGQTTIRIISTPEEACKFYTHFIKGVSIKCLGEDCPVCKSNMKICAENPDSFRDIQGWNPRQERFAVNVFDKTPVKRCSCGAEVKKNGNAYPSICPKCSLPIVAVEETPLNKVKVLAKGITVAELLNSIDSSILDNDGNKVGINNFDIVLYVTGTGKQQKIAPVPLSDKREPVEYNPEDKFDLTKIAIELNPEEILELQKGISLKDIFAIRRSVVPGGEDGDPAGASEAIRKEVSELLQS